MATQKKSANWWDTPDPKDRSFTNPNVNLLNQLQNMGVNVTNTSNPSAGSSYVSSGRPSVPVARPNTANPAQGGSYVSSGQPNVPARPQARPLQGPLTQTQAYQQARPRPNTDNPAAGSSYISSGRPGVFSGGPIQGPLTQAQAAERKPANPWQDVVNRLRPAMSQQSRPNASLGDREPLNQPMSLADQLSQGLERPDTGPAQIGGGQSQAPLIGTVDPVIRMPDAPAKPLEYTWSDMLSDNLGGLWGSTGNRIKQDWSDTWQAGQGNFFNPVAEAQQRNQAVTEARTNNTEIMSRAYELRQIYYQNQQRIANTVSGEGLDLTNPAQQVSLDPFIQQAEQELKKKLLDPQVSGLGQAGSVLSGVTQNAAQIPGLNMVPGLENVPGANIISPGGAVNVFGNTLGTAMQAVSAGTRSTVQVPIPVDVDGNAATNDFISVGEVFGSALEAVIDYNAWATNPSGWQWNKNPLTLLDQAFKDNVQRTLDTVYTVGPRVGDKLMPGANVSAWNESREIRAIATSVLDFSGSQAQANYIDAILNKDATIAKLEKQRNAAAMAAENLMLPQDARDANALLASQIQMQIESLKNADAYSLADTHVKPIQDALLSAVTDVTLLYDVAKLFSSGVLPSISPKDRRIVAVQKLANATDEEVLRAVDDLMGTTGQRPAWYRTFIEGGISQTQAEVKDAEIFLTHSLAGVSDKADIPVIMQYMVDNPEAFFTDGIPASLLKSESLKRLANAEGFIESPITQLQSENFKYMFASLRNLSGDFVNLPALSDAKATIKDVVVDLRNAIEVQSAVKNKVSPFTRPIPVGTSEAKVVETVNAAGDAMYRVEYVTKDGTVLARYPAPSKRLAEREVKFATQGIKNGRFTQDPFLLFLPRMMRNGFSLQVLTTRPGSWINNTLGAWVTGFTTATNTLDPVAVATQKAVKAFGENLPFDYLAPGSIGQTGAGGGIFDRGILKIMRQIRSGQTEIRLPGGRTLGFGENALKTKAWHAASNDLMRMTTDGEWRRVYEPALTAAGIDPAMQGVIRTALNRLSKDWDINTFYDTVTQYASGQVNKLDIGALGKHYESVLTPEMYTAIDNLVSKSVPREEFVSGFQRVIDTEIDRLSKSVGYDSPRTTAPVTTNLDVSDAVTEIQASIDALRRSGIDSADDGKRIQQLIAETRNHLQRIYQVVANARTPEAIEHFRSYWNDLDVLRRETYMNLNQMAQEARLTGDATLWADYHQSRLLYWREYGEQAIELANQTLLRITGQEDVPLPPRSSATIAQPVDAVSSVAATAPVSLSTDLPIDISQANVDNYLDRRWMFKQENFEEAQNFFRRAEQLYWETFHRVAAGQGDIRTIDVLLQTQQDITRLRTEARARLAPLTDEWREALSRFPERSAGRAAANNKYYTARAEMFYDLGVQVNAKIKAATAYITNLPEPVTYRHSEFGEVAIVGIRTDGVAIRLPTGAIATVAEDAIPLTTLQAAQKRIDAIKASGAKPLDNVAVEGIPNTFAKQVDKEAANFYDDLVSSRNNASTATPTITDGVADTILLLNGLRDKVETVADNLFTTTFRRLSPPQMASILDTASQVRSKFRRWAETASIYGNNMASFHMIDIGRHYRLDDLASIVMPYHNWTTRTFKNLIERQLTQPLVRHALQMESAFFEHENGDAAKEYVTIEIGGKEYKVYASLGKYLMSMSDWTSDPTYWETRQMDGPLGWIYAAGQITQAGIYPHVDLIDSQLRRLNGQESTFDGKYALPWLTLGWRATEAVLGSNIANIPLPQVMWGPRGRDIDNYTRALAAKVQNGEITAIDAQYAGAALNYIVNGEPVPSQMSEAQRKAAMLLAHRTIQEVGRAGLISSVSGTLTGTTTVPVQPGTNELAAGQEAYADAAYPNNPYGGTAAQRAVRESNPGVPVYWMRYDIKDAESGENPGIQARRMEKQQKVDEIYERQNDEIVQYILSQSGRVADYKVVDDIEKKYYAEIEKVNEQYADLPTGDFAPPDVTRMNPYERAVYQLEQILRYDSNRPASPSTEASPEEQVEGWAAIAAWENARLDYIERTIESMGVSFENGDPPMDAWTKRLMELTQNEYASTLIRKYKDLKYAPRVIRQWDTFGSFEKEMDQAQWTERENEIRARLGDAAVYKWQVYRRVKSENKSDYLEKNPQTAIANIIAYNPEAYDAAISLFGKEAWTTYKSYKNAQPTWPGDGATDAQIADYYEKLDAVRAKYPQAEEIAFWVDGRHRWWYTERSQDVDEVREGKYGADYNQAVALFGEDIFEVVSNFPSDGTKKEKAQYYDAHPEFEAFNAWKKQYSNTDNLGINDLPTINLAMPPAPEPVPASVSPWWTQYAETTARPYGSGREPINETPAQKKERLVKEAEFRAAEKAEKARVDALRKSGRAATIDSNSYKDKLDDEYSKRYGRSRGSSRRYYSGGRRGSRGYSSGRRYSSGGGYGGGAGYYGGGSNGSRLDGLSPALWQARQRNVTQLNRTGDINPSLWSSLLERLRRPGR